MADNTTVHVGENSPEQVAFKLMERIASVEKMSLHSTSSGNVADRKWILTTYYDCLGVVRHFSLPDNL